MNLSDVKIRVKRQFGDESAVQVTDADITRWANDAQRYIVLNNEGLLESIATLDALNGVQSYTLPIDCLILKSVTYKTPANGSYFHLVGYPLQQFDTYIDGWDGNSYGTADPNIYTVFSNQLRLFPIPNIDAPAGIKFFYSRSPVDLVNDVDNVDLPLVYHNAIVDFCLSRAYEMDEDWYSSSQKQGQVADVIHKARNRDGWGNQERYQTVTILPDDMW